MYKLWGGGGGGGRGSDVRPVLSTYDSGVRCGHLRTNCAHNGVVEVDPLLVAAMETDGGVVLAVVRHNCFK